MNNSEKNMEIVRAFMIAVFVNHDLSVLDQYMRDDYIQHNPDVPQGKEGFRKFFETTFKAMPDFKYTFKQFISDDHRVWVYSTTSGTHTGGEWLGVKPSGNSLNFDVVDIFRVQDGKLAPGDIDEELISRSLYTAGLPDPDLLIRTANECRVSNFLLWQVSYAEIHVSDKLWPEFGVEDLNAAIRDFGSRERRFGAVGAQVEEPPS